jgi:flagellar biosynthesis regulator FlbT
MNKVHRQIFFLVRNMKTDTIEPAMQEAYAAIFRLFKQHQFLTHKETEILHPNSKIATIDLTTEIPSLSVDTTVFLGYMFATAFKDKTILKVHTVLTHFEELVFKQNTDLLDQLYREAYREKFPGAKP